MLDTIVNWFKEDPDNCVAVSSLTFYRSSYMQCLYSVGRGIFWVVIFGYLETVT